MRRFAWTRILSVLLVLCMLIPVVSMGIPEVSAERVELDSNTTVEYFPVTLFDYDAETINNATHQADVDAVLGDVWKGLYFSQGSPNTAESFTYSTSAESHTDLTWAQVMGGTYYSDEACTTKVTVEAMTEDGGSSQWTSVTVQGQYNNVYTELADGSYYYKNGDNYEKVTYVDCYYYYYWTVRTESDQYEPMGSTITLYQKSGTTVGYKLMAGSTTLATLNSTDTSAKVGVTLYTAAGTQTTGALKYAVWNHWDKTNNSDAGNLLGQGIYSGLVAPQLDANKNIVFNVPDAGLFTLDPVAGKTIYTNVQIPFLFDADKNVYEFDSDTHGVYFANSTQAGGTSATPASNSKMFFANGGKQTYSGMAGQYGDGSTNLWAPFNSVQTISSQNAVEYHFGMNATIPFTMTSDGKMTNSTKDDIEFSFSGDDDVWIFIDGTLVADLGGIHNRLNVTINFATNKVTYFVSEDNTATYNNAKVPIVDGNGYSGSNTKGNLFKDMTFTDSTENDGTNGTGSYSTNLFNETTTVNGAITTTPGLLGTDRNTFAAKDNHELTIYYMERGGGSSNSKIWFNLPVKDTLSVQKIVDEQMVVDGEDIIYLDLNGCDKNGNLYNEDYARTAEQIAVLNNLNFGFTAYKNGEVMANKTYNLLNANGQVIATPATDANGHFYLKNGQTAKFTGEFKESGDTYYVVEDVKNGFIGTTYSATANAVDFSSTATNPVKDAYAYYTVDGTNADNVLTDTSVVLQSPSYTVKGDDDLEDSMTIVCENYINASLPTPSAIPNDDKFVLDFGLSAELEIFSNDLYIGNEPTIEINTAGLKYGTATYDPATKKVTYTPNKQLTGVEVIPYTLSVKATDNSGNIHEASGTANIYIMPATTMYYEENFSDFVTYTGSGWSEVGTAQTDKQEPGKVGTVGDSPYGSDAAYLSDSGDSNGSSMKVDATSGAKQFRYTFTGTGTSFYARTSATTGYLRIVIKDSSNKIVHSSYRDTRWTGNEATLYNVPVFTWNVEDSGVDYGTYTVEVTIAKKNAALGNGTEFYLDGIRVYNPLVENADAKAAYAADGESNMTAVTIRDKLVLEDSDKPEGWYILYTDSTIGTEDDYIAYGPKNEVYLNVGQSVTFALTNWDAGVNKVYLGLKAPAGSAKVTIGTTELSIGNSVDCFYDISDMGAITTGADGVKTITFTVTATEGLVSATTIKVTGAAEFTIIDKGPEVNVDGDEASGDDNGEEGDIVVDENGN